ncbi:MAG: LacI family DNA-binding transcriptional regulator [Pseudomonadota bacterium]
MGRTESINRRPTAYDVAERAGVSQPTVSKALRGHPSISQATRDRVAQAASDIGYQVNRSAARLRSNKTHTIALVVLCHKVDGTVEVSPFYQTLLGNIATAVSEAGHDLLVSYQSGDAPDFSKYADASLADGLLVIGSNEHHDAWAMVKDLRDSGSAVASWGGPSDGPGVVSADNVAGGAAIAQHFVASGRRAAAFVGADGQRQFMERFHGFADAIEAAGLLRPPAFTGFDPDRVRQGYEATDQLLKQGMACDAIFAATDLMAIGVIHRLDEAGIAVPGTIAVAGFDGVDAGRYCRPALTTIEQDMAAAGRLLVAQLLGGDGAELAIGLRSPVKLILRASG